MSGVTEAMVDILNAESFKCVLESGYANLDNNKQHVNNLNVFPVPDGDTGTNMSLTVQYAVKEALNCNSESISDIASAGATGALMGARGNSGVILSQLFRGFANSCKGKRFLNIDDVIDALLEASKVAYNAVMKPTEGTILTVAREMAEFVDEHRCEFTDWRSMLENLIERGNESLQNTPNLLDVLKEAGVVDAGGQGLLYFFEGVLRAVDGTAVELKEAEPQQESAVEFSGEAKDIEFGYCTEFLIRSNMQKSYEKYLIDKLIKLGDSLLVIEDAGVIKIHVHTNEPWNAMKLAAGCGELIKIKIDNMREQHNEIYQEELKRQKIDIYSKEHVKYNIIAVSSGEGLSQILRDLGVAYIIEGGQTMNPSTQDFLDIISNTNADNYILLPNNKNIILAAKQAESISDKNIAVIETRTIPEAIGALMNFNEDFTLEENIEDMRRSFSHIKTGEITFAVRDSVVGNQFIRKDDIIGIEGGNIVCSEPKVEIAALYLIDNMVDDAELLTLYYGVDVKKSDAKHLMKVIEKKYPDINVELVYGGQPLYYYIISAE